MYKILVTSEWELSVCVGTYETYESAKEQMKKMVVHLITQNDSYQDGEWEAWKKRFPKKVQTVLTALENTGSAPAGNYDLDGEVNNHSYSVCDNNLDIDVIDDDAPGYKVSTDLFELDEEAESHSFSLWRNGESLIIAMLENEE